MNILWVTSERVNPHSGGIARVTYLLAEGLANKGVRSYSAYLHRNDNIQSPSNVFEQEVLVDGEDHVRQYSVILTSCNIDFVVVQGGYTLMNQELVYLRGVIDKISCHIPLFLVFHSMPGYELYFLDWSILIRKICSKDWREYSKQFVLQTIMMMNKKLLQKQLYQKYHTPYQIADKVILLSSSYIEDFNSLAHGVAKTKYVSIPNMLTYPVIKEAFNKKKQVLIVARMDERSKRIKLALQIWGKLPIRLIEEGWKLSIVGDGEDLTYYQDYVKSKGIKGVSFEGRQNPLPYYQDASVFMMTSSYEGWPMTLMEAMQNGCVPIVFDSFKAVYEIIMNEKNGVIIREGDIQAYESQLKKLMSDNKWRENLAAKALEDCKRYKAENVIQMWVDLFNNA